MTAFLCSVQVQKLKGMVEQQRFLRLQHLLKQSNIYSKFLLKRMEEQRQRQEKKDQQDREKSKRKRSLQGKAVRLLFDRHVVHVLQSLSHYTMSYPIVPCTPCMMCCNPYPHCTVCHMCYNPYPIV